MTEKCVPAEGAEYGSAEHDVIWLEPRCEEESYEGRTWSTRPGEACSDCNIPWIKYVRAPTNPTWQPIEAVPEGEHVLLWFPKGERGIGGIEAATVYHEKDGPSRCGFSFWTHGGPNAGSDWDTSEAPTLWMPLPSGPAQQERPASPRDAADLAAARAEIERLRDAFNNEQTRRSEQADFYLAREAALRTELAAACQERDALRAAVEPNATDINVLEEQRDYWRGAYERMATQNIEMVAKRDAVIGRLRSKIKAARGILLKDAIADCEGCGSREFPRLPECASCQDAVDERIHRAAHGEGHE